MAAPLKSTEKAAEIVEAFQRLYMEGAGYMERAPRWIRLFGFERMIK